MTEPKELLPCPFCGGTARKVKHSAGVPGTTGYDRWHGVACAGCNACVGARDRRFRTSADAIAVWNTRTPQPTQEIDWIGASCHHLLQPPTQAQAVAVPLTDEQIEAESPKYYVEDLLDFKAGVRFAERHHGIKGGQHG